MCTRASWLSVFLLELDPARFAHELSLGDARETLCSAVSNTGPGLTGAQRGGDLDKGGNEEAAFPEGSQ